VLAKWVGPNSFEHLEPIHPGQFEVQQH
jgi:hypothetical protein